VLVALLAHWLAYYSLSHFAQVKQGMLSHLVKPRTKNGASIIAKTDMHAAPTRRHCIAIKTQTSGAPQATATLVDQTVVAHARTSAQQQHQPTTVDAAPHTLHPL
jgi:hypothetical protein